MSGWREVEFTGDRVRYRKRGGAYADSEHGQAFEVEYWHDARREWRAVRNGSSRDFFALGLKAGALAAREGVQEDLFA